MAAIEVDNVSFGYTDETVINGVTFAVAEGSIAMLIGPNGSGKTTLLKILVGLLDPTSGSVQISETSPSQARHIVGYVPQRVDFDKNFPVTVREFLELTHTLSQQAIATLGMLGVPELLHKKIGELSGGQLQRVMIGRSLLGNPKILFLDEPVSGIDLGGEQDFYQIIKDIRDQHQVTIVLVSHEIHIVNQVADQVVCINKHMLCCGVPSKVLLPEVVEKLYGTNAALYEHQC